MLIPRVIVLDFLCLCAARTAVTAAIVLEFLCARRMRLNTRNPESIFNSQDILTVLNVLCAIEVSFTLLYLNSEFTAGSMNAWCVRRVGFGATPRVFMTSLSSIFLAKSQEIPCIQYMHLFFARRTGCFVSVAGALTQM